MDAIEEFFAGFSINSYLLYEAIVSSTDGYVYIVDMKDDMALVSENMHRDFELPGRSVHHLPATWGELLHPRDRKRFFDSMERMVSGEVEDHNLEYQVKNRKGEYIWVVCRGVLKRKPDGEPDFFAGIVTDLGDKGKIDYTTGLSTQRECEKQVTQTLRQSRGRIGAASFCLVWTTLPGSITSTITSLATWCCGSLLRIFRTGCLTTAIFSVSMVTSLPSCSITPPSKT